MKKLIGICFFFFTCPLLANDRLEHKIPVAEGVALPSSSLTLLLQENPTGLAHVNGHQIGLGYFKNDSKTRNDLNYTYGGGDWGIGLDYHNDNPDDGSTKSSFQSLGVGFDLGSFAIGFNSYQNADDDSSDLLNFNSVGITLNPMGSHRIGIVAYNFANSSETSKKHAVGYAYIDTKFGFIIDHIIYGDDRSITSPGFVYFNNQFQFSISQRKWKDGGTNDDDATRVAVGFSLANYQINLYKDFSLDSGISVSTVF